MEHHPQDPGLPLDDADRDGHEQDLESLDLERGEQVAEYVDTDDAHSVPASLPTPTYEPTGRPDIDTILDRLADLDGAPTNDHADVYEDVHRRLHETLLAAGEGGDPSEGAS